MKDLDLSAKMTPTGRTESPGVLPPSGCLGIELVRIQTSIYLDTIHGTEFSQLDSNFMYLQGSDTLEKSLKTLKIMEPLKNLEFNLNFTNFTKNMEFSLNFKENK